MNKINSIVLATSCLALSFCQQETSKETIEASASKKEIIGYVPGFRGLLDEKDIDANKLTIINYAFVDVKDSLAWLTNLETDSVNFRKLNYLKKDNPDLKIVISIGGWSWSENFSDAVLPASSREKFAKSGTKIVADYNLDGIDIDWEYPGLKGEDNVFRDEDKENFTLMFEAIRKELDALAVTTGKKYIVSTALPCFPRLFEVTNMGDVAKHIDFVNIMAYDFYVAGDTVGHHSNLYPSENYEKENSADKAVKTYIEQGVPADKLVLGLPFYGRSWTMKSSDNLGILRPRDEVMRGGGFTFIKDSLMAKPEFVRYWDDAAKSPYLFNAENNQLVVYDDESSVKLKCEYVNDNGLAGIMFWQYASDPKEYLLDVVNEHLD